MMLMICKATRLGMLCLMKMIFFVPQVLMSKFIMMIACLLFMMIAIFDDYCDDMYAIKNNDKHETCHHDFNFQLDYASRDSYFVEFAPTTIHEKNYAYVESRKISMLMNHEKNALCDDYIVEFIHD